MLGGARHTGRFERQLAPGETVAGAVFVPVAADGTFCVSCNAPVDVIVDVTGVFSDAGTLRFTPVPPTRMVDTRGWHRWMARPSSSRADHRDRRSTRAAVAVTGTITMVDPGVGGYLTGTICGQPVGADSSVNGRRRSVMANSLTVGLSPGATCASRRWSRRTRCSTRQAGGRQGETAAGSVLATTMVAVISPLRPPTPALAAPASQRVYMVTDSVGLGAKDAIPRPFRPIGR